MTRTHGPVSERRGTFVNNLLSFGIFGALQRICWKFPECQESFLHAKTSSHFWTLLRNLGGVRITGRKPGKLEERLTAGRTVDLQYKGGINVVEGKIYK